VFDFHAADDRYCISMQFIDGNTLVASRGAAFQTIVHQALMVCDALAYAHRAGIVHRDIKSSNVLVDARGVCYLTDFGLASAASTSSGDDVAEVMGGGTLPAMSPQQLAGAPAAVADDVYALGALLYELLSGAPLFHPDVTPARIRAEQPARLTSDGTGQALPDSLGKLVGAMLTKSPEQRPAGIGAVRSVLEEVQADFPRDVADAGDAGDVIQPISRRRPGAAQAPSTPTAPARRQPADRAGGLPPAVVYGGLAFLLAIAIVVIFLLPDAVNEQRSRAAQETDDTAEPAPPPELEPAAPSPAALAVKREIADEILGELLVVEDRLKAVGVAVWGGKDWSDATGIVAAGDDAYQDRRYEDAVTAYRDALNRMKILEPRAEQILAQALADGGAAIDAGDAPVAVRNFELALAVDAVNAQARAGLERASRLDEVLELTRRATDTESAGDLAAAAALYEQALAIDEAWTPAREGLSRTRAGVARLGYETRMAAGFAALSGKEYDRARQEFSAALRIRPGNADAQAAIRQVDEELRVADVIRLQARARIAEAGEDWATAVGHYEEILARDPAVTSARKNLERAKARRQLGELLDLAISKSDEFNDDRIAREARAVLERGAAVTDSGPVLEGQTERLRESLRVAAIPVPVVFQSDNQTEVVIYKVGSLGMFQSRTLDLKPGRYVAVGSRDGYRDVRRSFQVLPQGTDAPIVMSCEEPI